MMLVSDPARTRSIVWISGIGRDFPLGCNHGDVLEAGASGWSGISAHHPECNFLEISGGGGAAFVAKAVDALAMPSLPRRLMLWRSRESRRLVAVRVSAVR